MLYLQQSRSICNFHFVTALTETFDVTLSFRFNFESRYSKKVWWKVCSAVPFLFMIYDEKLEDSKIASLA